MTNENTKQAAEKLFASTGHDVLYANPKGEFFTSENIGALSLKPGQKLEKFERPKQVTEVPTIKPKSAEDLIAEIKNIATIALAELGRDVEAKGKNRTTVIAAFDARISELTALIEVNPSDNGNKDSEAQK